MSTRNMDHLPGMSFAAPIHKWLLLNGFVYSETRADEIETCFDGPAGERLVLSDDGVETPFWSLYYPDNTEVAEQPNPNETGSWDVQPMGQ